MIGRRVEVTAALVRQAYGNIYLQPMLVEIAWAAIRHPGYLKSLHHRHVTGNGGYRSKSAQAKAIITVAHAILVIIWHVLATGTPYDDLGADYFDRRTNPDREAQRLIARLEAPGHRRRRRLTRTPGSRRHTPPPAKHPCPPADHSRIRTNAPRFRRTEPDVPIHQSPL